MSAVNNSEVTSLIQPFKATVSTAASPAETLNADHSVSISPSLHRDVGKAGSGGPEQTFRQLCLSFHQDEIFEKTYQTPLHRSSGGGCSGGGASALPASVNSF